MNREWTDGAGATWMRLELHPDGDCPPLVYIDVNVERAGDRLTVRYRAVGDIEMLRIPAPATPARTDELWKQTCFEVFVAPVGGERYFEFNFSPSGQWAAYRFARYREGMENAPADDPAIDAAWDANQLDLRAAVAMEGLPSGTPLRVALSAVVEIIDGSKTYWALEHPPGKPDFHHPASFAFYLPPTDAS